jgi:thiol-disulfide isomerase/thioredoxin
MKRWLALGLFALLLAPTMSASAPSGDLRAFVRGSWNQLREAHAGHPLIVHFWGVTCGPCRAEMPQWGQFLKQHPKLPLVTIDADLVPNDASNVKSMLAQSGLSGSENWMFDDDFVERLRYEIDPRWQGDIPRTLLIARDGSTTTIDGVADFGKVASWWRDQSAAAK